MKGAKPDTKTESLLPLDSPNWLPLKYAHRSLSQWSGDQILATKDLNDALTDDKSPVRSMLRRYEGPDTLLPPMFWAEFKVSWSGALFVCDPGSPVCRSPGVYFVWKPDLEKKWPTVFGLKTATIKGKQSTSEAPRRTPGPTANEGLATARRARDASGWQSRQPTPTAPEMLQCCENNLDWQPT